MNEWGAMPNTVTLNVILSFAILTNEVCSPDQGEDKVILAYPMELTV